MFVDLYNKGIIYRGERIINWDPQARTALSDIEVIHEDVQGAFYHFKYPFADGEGYIEMRQHVRKQCLEIQPLSSI